MLKESKVAVISAILVRLECLFYLYSLVSQGRRYLSNLGGFVLKESKVAVISAILEDLC